MSCRCSHAGCPTCDAPPLEHIDSPDCWCEPTLSYRDPETDVCVWIHKDTTTEGLN